MMIETTNRKLITLDFSDDEDLPFIDEEEIKMMANKAVGRGELYSSPKNINCAYSILTDKETSALFTYRLCDCGELKDKNAIADDHLLILSKERFDSMDLFEHLKGYSLKAYKDEDDYDNDKKPIISSFFVSETLLSFSKDNQKEYESYLKQINAKMRLEKIPTCSICPFYDKHADSDELVRITESINSAEQLQREKLELLLADDYQVFYSSYIKWSTLKPLVEFTYQDNQYYLIHYWDELLYIQLEDDEDIFYPDHASKGHMSGYRIKEEKHSIFEGHELCLRIYPFGTLIYQDVSTLDAVEEITVKIPAL